MNAPLIEAVRVMPDALHEFMSSVFLATQMPEADAVRVADLLIASDLRGLSRHGTRMAVQYVDAMLAGKVNPRPSLQIFQESPTTAVVDGDGGIGHLAAYKAAHIAVSKAKELGLGAAVSRNHFHFGAAGNYSRIAITKDCIGMATSAHRFDINPERCIFDASGGSPLSFAIPTEDQPPLVLDMACTLGLGKGWEDMFEILPSGFFKMLGLASICIGLGGCLPGIAEFSQEVYPQAWENANQGALILAIDISRFRPMADFKRDIDHYVATARNLHPAPGHDRADLPGGLELDREREWADIGIPLDQHHRETLKILADQFQLFLPY